MTAQKIPTWFWVVAGLGLVWNAMGAMAFIQSMMITPEAISELKPDHQQHISDTPLWATIAFALAVFGGLIGCLLLLLKNKLALPVLILSFLGILTQMVNSFVLMNGYEVFGPGGLAMPIMILIIAPLLIWLAKSAISKGWLN